MRRSRTPRSQAEARAWCCRAMSARRVGATGPTLRAMPPAAAATRPVQVRPFEARDLDAAAELLAARHRRHRLAEPLLDPAYEASGAARIEIESLLAADSATAWAASAGGSLVGFMVGIAKDPATWGGNAWVEAAGHAATGLAVVRALYAVAAAAWVDEGRANHHVLVPATDEDLVEAWFSLDFGQQHLHAVREAPPAAFGVHPKAELAIRGATRADLPALAELDLVLPRHSSLAPVFSRLPIQHVAEVLAGLEHEFDDPRFTTFVAEANGRVVGSATGCSLEQSSTNTSLIRPARAGFLGYAAVLPEARGQGVGRALGETILAWGRDAGYQAIATDWRSTNLEADGAWRGLGFRPTFRRLHRAIT
jgi:GNAT superfamily N-acetyltransferase